jgi:hypothetical protein
MRKFIVTTAAALVASALFATSSFAAGPWFCNQYATAAVWAEQLNVADGCGDFGLRWSYNYAGHYAWCLAVSPGMANSERAARKWSLISCGAI